MDTRISSSILFNQGLTGMTTAQTAMAKAMQEISSGQRQVRPSEDPLGSASLAKLESSVGRLEQYQRNADAADSRLAQTENALQGVVETLQRAREAAIQFNNGSYDDATREPLRAEFGALRDQLLSLLNTQDERGDYIFSGTQATTAPYTYNPAAVPPASPYSFAATGASPLNIEIAPGQQVQVGWVADGFGDVLNALDTLSQPPPAGPTTVDAPTFDTLVNATDTATLMRGEVGSNMQAVELARQSNDSELYIYTQTLSTLRDTDYAAAVTELNKQTLLLQASQSTLTKVQGLSLFNMI